MLKFRLRLLLKSKKNCTQIILDVCRPISAESSKQFRQS
jgi:hypothetical protein